MAGGSRPQRGLHLAAVEGARVRDEVDHGLQGDKGDFPDPAAALLGTGSEAARATAAVAEPRRRVDVERPNDASNASGLPILIFAGIMLLVLAIIVALAA